MFSFITAELTCCFLAKEEVNDQLHAPDQILTFVPCPCRCCFPCLEFFALHNPLIVTLVEILQQLEQCVPIRLQEFPVRQVHVQAISRMEEMELIKYMVEDMKWPKGCVGDYAES